MTILDDIRQELGPRGGALRRSMISLPSNVPPSGGAGCWPMAEMEESKSTKALHDGCAQIRRKSILPDPTQRISFTPGFRSTATMQPRDVEHGGRAA